MASASFEAKSIGYLSIEMAENFEKAFKTLVGLSPEMAKFGAVAAKVADVVAKITLVGPIVQLAQKFAALGEVIKIAFSPFTAAIGAVGKIFSGIKNILMLPFGIMSKAFSGLSKAWDFITKPAEGANASAYEAAKLNMSAVQLHELEYAEKASGTNGQFKSLLENVRSGLLDVSKAKGFAALGLDADALASGNAVDATQAVFQAIQKRFGEMGYSFNNRFHKAYYDEAGFGDFMSFEDAKAMNSGFFDTTMGHFQNFMKTTQYNEKSFRKLNTRVVEVQRAFDNLHKQLSARLGPAASRVAGIFVNVLSKLGEAIFTDENIKKIENGINKIAEEIESFFSSDEAANKIKEFVDITCEVLAQFADGLMTALDWIPGVNFSDDVRNVFKTPEREAEKFLKDSYADDMLKIKQFAKANSLRYSGERKLGEEWRQASEAYKVYEGAEKGNQYKFITEKGRDRITFKILGIAGADKGREMLKHEVLFENGIVR